MHRYLLPQGFWQGRLLEGVQAYPRRPPAGVGAVVGSGLRGCPEGCITDWGWGGGTRSLTALSSGPGQSSGSHAERRLRDTPHGLLGNAPGLSCSSHPAGTEAGKRLGKGPAAICPSLGQASLIAATLGLRAGRGHTCVWAQFPVMFALQTLAHERASGAQWARRSSELARAVPEPLGGVGVLPATP